MIAKFFFTVSAITICSCPLFSETYNTQTHQENNKFQQPRTSTKSFSFFTGKIKGQRVRLRLTPDLEGYVVKELSKNDLVSVKDEIGDYWAIEPPTGMKVFIFRSFVLEGTVEGKNVNIRLEPSLESPVIGHLNSGDRVNGIVSSSNNKWLEIDPPKSIKFFISKEFIEYAGGPEFKTQTEKKCEKVLESLKNATALSKSELSKSFEEIDFNSIKQNFDEIIQDHSDFPEHITKAKENLTAFQEAYLQKKIDFLETKTKSTEYISNNNNNDSPRELPSEEPNYKVKIWEPIEEANYLSWTKQNDNKSIEEYYEEEKLNMKSITGLLEPYDSLVQNKPGDYVLKNRNMPKAYLYSTKINLQSHIGKKITVYCSPRSNNNFAFPAFFVHMVEEE